MVRKIQLTKNVVWIAVSTGLILLIPFTAMLFTDEVNWGILDFVIAGALLFSAGSGYVLLSRKMNNLFYRAAAALAVISAFTLIWINLAVGIIGSEGNPPNLMYIGVLLIGVIGVSVARFRPKGMALALFVTALAQILAGVIAMIAGWGGVLAIDLFFVSMWMGSAWLFRRASGTDPGMT